MTVDTEKAFRDILSQWPDPHYLVGPAEMRELKRPTQTARPDNLFARHHDKYTIFENETDPEDRKYGVLYRPVGVKPGGQLSDDQITFHEKRIGFALPHPMRDVYRTFNGGSASHLYWGDKDAPKLNDHSVYVGVDGFLPLEDVGPLGPLLAPERPELDVSVLNNRLIALAVNHAQAFVLDYTKGDDPAVGHIQIWKDTDDPLAELDTDAVWWPNMAVFFRGLYLQDRIGR